MKISDYIFDCPIKRFLTTSTNLCRVRLFITDQQKIYVVLTDLGREVSITSVTNTLEKICTELIEKGLVPSQSVFIEHYEPTDCVRYQDTFDIIEFEDSCLKINPKWHPKSLEEIKILLTCDDNEFYIPTRNNERLWKEVQLRKHHINSYTGSAPFYSAKTIQRRIEIEEQKISKQELEKLVERGANEQELQRILKKDLSLFGEYFSRPYDEYICFSEFPISSRKVDFVVFTGRSRMEIVLIEVKGAHFNLVNQNKYENFSSNVEVARSQLRNHWNYIYKTYDAFRENMHNLRIAVEQGDTPYNAFIGPQAQLQVDPEKDISITNVIICGKMKDNLEDSRKRHMYEMHEFERSIYLETWDSWLMKLDR